jgi:hypothetical protein
MDSRRTSSTECQEMPATIAAQREQLFKASAVIEMCRYACASHVEGFDTEQLAEALHVADELIDAAAEVLEQFSGDHVDRQQDE